MPNNPNKSIHGSKEPPREDEGSPPSHNLWIGNLSNDTTDADLMDMFAMYGALDSVTTYSSRNYAFIYFKRLEDARTAKDALQGALLRGSHIKIEFARAAKPSKQLWVGGINLSITKEQLEGEFSKFGKIEDLKFLRDRNSALIDYSRLEDAVGALKDMNGKRLGGENLRVDYLRSQPSRRGENLSDNDARDGRFNNRSVGPPEPFWMRADGARKFSESSQFGNKRPAPSQHSGGRREGQPSNVLWVCYPPSVQIDEQMLHNAMILFGEIERIKSYPAKHYSFVEFRSVDEARRAKEGLQGRLFNDPRIQILFSSSESAPPKDTPGFFTGTKGPGSDMFFHEPPLGPGPVELFGPGRPMLPNNFPGLLGPNGISSVNMPMRPFGPQGGLDPLLSGPEMYTELAGPLHNFQETNGNIPMDQNRRRPSAPARGLLPTPAPGVQPPIIPSPVTWDGSDAKPFLRESKRSRIDSPPVNEISFPARVMDSHGSQGDQSYGLEPQLSRGTSGLLTQSRISNSPAGMRVTGVGLPSQALQDNDHCWRGTIAKGGSPVCDARCVPIGKGIYFQLPEIVNCSARTGLDMLAKHYTDASGFDIVFFLPDSEDDFPSYTEFLRYLGEKNRAGVAKIDDATTLFLVPPSDFLTKVMNVSGPERLYGVVLKMPQQMPNASVQLQRTIPTSQYIDTQQLRPSRTDYRLLNQKDRLLQMDYTHLSKPLLPANRESQSLRSVSQDYASNPPLIPKDGISLTPELFATLAALLPANKQSPPPSIIQQPQTSFSSSSTTDKTIASQGWKQEHKPNSSPYHPREEQTVNPSRERDMVRLTQAPSLSQFPVDSHVNGTVNSTQSMIASPQIQNPAQNEAQQGVSPSMPSTIFNSLFQGGQFTVSQQANLQFQLDANLNSNNRYETTNATEASGLFHSSVFQQSQTALVQGMSVSPSQLSSSADDNLNSGFSNPMQQTQSGPGNGQGTTDGEVDRNQRYHSTLQFAATLLLQIQQQQQQESSKEPQGSGNH